MLIDPKKAISEGWITGVVDNPSPNAIDFTVDRMFSIDHTKPFHLGKCNKQMRGGTELETVDGQWSINPGEIVDCLSDMYVSLPVGVAALLVIRSTLARNGILLHSGLYDSMFQGHIGAILHNRSGPATIERGAAIGQIIFVPSDSTNEYLGGYNHEAGDNPNN